MVTKKSSTPQLSTPLCWTCERGAEHEPKDCRNGLGLTRVHVIRRAKDLLISHAMQKALEIISDGAYSMDRDEIELIACAALKLAKEDK